MILSRSVKEASNWLFRAQDVNGSGGVSKFYHINKEGWCKEDYPEVSGYIIETFLKLYKKTNNKEYLDRSKRMADWELSVQDKGGKWEYVFDTGQVILGLLEIYKITKEKKYLDSIIKAANWLVKMQSTDGHWRKGIFACGLKNRLMKAIGGLKHSYNTRTAWALLKVWEITKNKEYKISAIKNLERVLSYQLKNGYYKNATTSNHFLIYTARGILESGLILKVEKYIDSVEKFAQNLLKLIKKNGFLSGRINKNWKSISNSNYLSANAQFSVLLCKLYKITKKKEYFLAAKKLLDYLKENQKLKCGNPDIKGGISGSNPLNGEFEPNKILPWATKFYIDALLLDKKH